MIPFKSVVTAINILIAISLGAYLCKDAKGDNLNLGFIVFVLLVANTVCIWI